MDATNVYSGAQRLRQRIFVTGVLFTGALSAATLPQEQLDAEVHYYDGGGVEVSGPTLQARKNFGDKASVSGSYQVDSISSASVDVVTSASPYRDTRHLLSLGGDYLFEDTLFGISANASSEEDYTATSLDFRIKQSLFAGMSELSLGVSREWDTVERVDTAFSAEADRYRYLVSLSQILSPTMLLDLNYEASVDKGWLSNPYRSARILGSSVPERYPTTRSGNAFSLRGIKHLGWDTAALVDYRYFWDTWDLSAHTICLELNRYLGTALLGELRYRFYTQSDASFYADNFTQELNYMARDKELSKFNNHSVGVSVSYSFSGNIRDIMSDGSQLSFSYDYFDYNYDNFTDLRSGNLYSFDAHLIQLIFSLRY